MLGPYRDSSCILLLLWCGDPAALDLQARPLHMLQQVMDGVDVGAGQVITLVLALGSCRVVCLPVLPCPHH